LNRRRDRYGTDRAGRRRLLLEIVEAVAAPWDGRGSASACRPTGPAPAHADDRALADYDELVAELNDRPWPTCTCAGRNPPRRVGLPTSTRSRANRRRFDGHVIANNGFDQASANAVIEAGIADAVSFARSFIANPDLVTRFAMARDLAAGDPGTYYTGGAGATSTTP